MLPSHPVRRRSIALEKSLLKIFLLLSIFTLSFIDLHNAPFVSGVITELRMNEGTGTTTADGSGNNHPGTLTNGAAWTTGKYGQGINLDGTNDYINIADHADYTLTPALSYTWSLWLKSNSMKEWSTVWSQTLNNANFFYFYAHTTTDPDGGPVTNGLSVYWWNTNGTNKLGVHSNNNVLTVGEWAYVTVTYDGTKTQASRFTIYVNGVDVTNRTDVSSSGTLAAINPTNTRIGSNQPFGEYLNGAVDEARYYRRLLTPAEITTDMNTGNAPDTQAPTVSVTAPASGNVSGTVNVTATAADNIGVTGIQFLLDGVNLGAEDVSAPYTVSWNTSTATNGAHAITARARDAAGNTTTSTVVDVTVNNDTQAPTVSLTSPAAGTVSGTVNVSADATDNTGVTGVQFLLDGVNLAAEDISAPYTISWNSTTIADGNHILTARARDAAGNITTSTGVTVNVLNTVPDTQAPTVSVTAPAAGNVSGTVNVTATAADNIGVAGVQFLLDGANLGAEDVSSPYSISWNTSTATNGSHTLTARVRDAAGNTTVSTSVAVTVNNDVQAPVVSLTAPAAGTVTATVNVSANASDNIGVAGVEFLLDGASLGAEDVSSPYTVSWNTTIATNGSHNLSARARDAAGNITTSAVVIVTVSNTATTLITALPLDEGSGTAAADISGSSHPGALTNGPTWTTGKYGQGVNLDGTNDYIGITDHNDFSLDPTQKYTWSLWLKNTSMKEWSTVWSQTLNNANFFYFYAHTTTDPDGGPVTNGLSVYWWNTNGTNKLGVHSNNNVLTIGQWSYVTVTYDGALTQANRFTIYVNGVDVTNRTDVSSSGALVAINPANTRIGSNQPFGEYLNGAVDEVRYYKRLLTPAEITNDMNSPMGVDNTAPVANITAPAAGTVSGTVNVTANATDNVGVAGVQFLLDGVNLGAEDVSSPYTIAWNSTTIADGDHTLTARARDAAGNITTSAGVIVNVVNTDTQSPVVNITAPAAGNVAGTINVTATATDNIGVTGVQFLLDGVNLGAEDLVAPYAVSWNTLTAGNGNHTLTARARDAAGNATTSSDVIVTVNNDIEGPAVTITAPAAGNIAGSVNVTATATDNTGVTGVQFLLDGANLGAEDLVAPYTVSWNTLTAANGNHTLTARARDAAGNITTSDPVIITVNNDLQGPVVSITDPAAGIVLGTIDVTASATDNVGVVGVQFLLDGASLGAEDLVAPYAVSWNTTSIADGNHTLTARARDAAGNITVSAGVTVTVQNHPPDTEPPSPEVTSPAPGNVAGTVTVTATATDNIGVVGVQFLLDGANLGTEDLSAPYSVSWNTTATANGLHNLTVRARDAAGNITISEAIVITVNNDLQAPAVSITSPAAGTVAGVINVTADATDNVDVVGVQFLLDGANLGTEDVSAPYTVLWNTAAVADGNHTLTARARDAAGNITTSAAILVSVLNTPPDTQAPTVSVTAPATGTVTGLVNVTASASDNTGVVGVQFLLDGVNLGSEDLSSPYTVSWNTATATNGSHTLTARARDAAGNATTSTSVIVTVSNTTTNLIVALPFDEGSGTNAADVSGKNHPGTLSGATWTPGKYLQSVNLNGSSNYVNIADHADLTLDPTQSYTWSAWVKGTNLNEWGTIWSQTIDANNFLYFYAHSTGDADAGPVTNGISAYWWTGNNRLVLHSNNNVLTAGQLSYVTITYNGTLAQASRFTIYVNGVDVTNRTDVVSSGTITAINPTNIRLGSNQPFGDYFNGAIDEVRYYQKALTAAEIQTDMNTPLGVDNSAPAVSITAPAAGNVSGTINVTANATDNTGVVGVQFLLDGVNLGSEDLSAPYSVSWNTGMASGGSHTLTARARDAAGNITTSAPVIVTITADFSFTILAPSKSAEVTGSADYDVSVVYQNGFTSNNVVLGVTGLPANVTGSFVVNPLTAQGQTQFHVVTSNAAPGSYNFTLSATAESITHTQQATLVINGPGDFALSASPSVQNVTAGNGTSYTINLTKSGTFANPVTLSVTGLPATMTASFNPASPVPAANSVLTITTTAATPAGTYSLTVQGVSGSLTHTTPISLTVTTTPPPTWPVTNLGAGWDMPIGAAFSKDGQKLFVWEKAGKVYVCNRNATTQLYDKQTTPVLDITAEVGNWDDHGLNGFALDPDFENNGYIYCLYVVDRHYLLNFGTPNYNPNTTDAASAAQATIGRVSRFHTNTTGGNIIADPASRLILIGETKSTGISVLHDSHGMGSLVFASDGTLLVSAGDGGTYNSTDVGNNGQTYYAQALADGIITQKENIGAMRAQSLSSHNGKILRIDPATGNGISSNPFYVAATPRAPRSRVWALGFRNPFRFNIRPGKGSTNPEAGDIGELYVGDVGWRTYEELDIVKNGGSNFGWPIFEGVNYEAPGQPGESPYSAIAPANTDEPNPLFGTAGCTQQYFTFNNLIKQATADGSTTVFNPCNPSVPITGTVPYRYVHNRPAIDWKHFEDSSRVPKFNGNNASFAQIGTAASGVAGSPFPGNCSVGGFWYTGNLFPANYRNTYFHADYGAQWIKTFTIGFTDVVQKVEDFASGMVAITCLIENPLDGTLVYVDIGTNSVKRIGYGGNQFPVAKATSNVTYGPSTLNVNFTGSNSFDPEGGALTYSWNFGDGSAVNTTANPVHAFTATGPKKFVVTLTVKDNMNAAAVDSVIVSVNNTPPVVHITSPVNNSTYRPLGTDTLYALTANVTDAEHVPGQLKYEWQKILRHNNHEHPSPIDTIKSTSVSVARIGCNGEEYYWMVRLRVTDAAGLYTEDSSKIYPDCSATLLLRQFYVEQTAGENVVKWVTENDQPVKNFEVQASADGTHFYSINTQASKNRSGLNKYGFADNSFPKGINYYRLKMVASDAPARYSSIVKVVSENRGQGMLIFPNPVLNKFSIRYNAKAAGTVTIRISDMSGRLVNTSVKSVGKGQNIISMENMPAWKPGMFLISVQEGSTVQQGKLLYQGFKF